jgi:hypothetical protein
MKLSRFATLFLTGALALGAAACAHDDAGSNANGSTGTQASGELKSPGEVEKEDGSTISVATEPDGTKREERSFKSGEVARVSRVTRSDGTRTATVEMRDGRRAELKEEGEVEKALEASSDWLVSAASKTWDTTKDVGREIGDKTEDVASKTAETGKDVGKKVGKGIKRGAQEVADKTEDAAGKVKKGAKKVVDKVRN